MAKKAKPNPRAHMALAQQAKQHMTNAQKVLDQLIAMHQQEAQGEQPAPTPSGAPGPMPGGVSPLGGMAK